MDAAEAFYKLTEFSAKHPEFLFVHAATLDQGLLELDKKAALWNRLGGDCKIEILDELIEFKADDI